MTQTPNLNSATVVELATWFQAGDVTPTNYLDHCLHVIKRKNHHLNAVLDIFPEDAKNAAEASKVRYSKGQPLSPIDGIPIGVKANIAVKGQVCHGGIKAYAESISREDADVVKNLRQAGAIILCSLNMEEGALGATTDNPWFGKTYNPLQSGYTPGGSSGGSAAAVAAGMVPIALGTDTMGSVRIPSAYCGIVGHKPSQGLVSIKAVMPLSPTLDAVGPHVRTLNDAALVVPVLAGLRIQYKMVPLKTLSFAPMAISEDIDILPDIKSLFNKLVSGLSKSEGFTQRPDVLEGYDPGQTRRAGLLISEVEGARFHVERYEQDQDGFSAHFQGLMSWGVRQPLEKVTSAYARIATAKAMIEAALQTTDVILAPTAGQTAFPFGDPVPAGQADFTAIANFAGLPAASIPVGVTRNGLPIGLQIIGAKGQDEFVLRAAQFIQSAFK